MRKTILIISVFFIFSSCRSSKNTCGCTSNTKQIQQQHPSTILISEATVKQ